MDESTLTEMSLLADNRDALCEELCKFAVKSKLTKASIHRGASSYFCVDCSDTSDRRGHKRQLTSRATATYTTAFT